MGSEGLAGEQLTMLMTLRLHARDAASPRPLLGDAYAADVLARAGEPLHGDHALDGNLYAVCARARLVDEVTLDFLARHPDAVVLHLGCGLDSRVLRVDPGPGVAWYDVDQQPVVDLRRRLYAERPGTTTVATRVEEPGWWARVPDGRPRLVVAEGLMMYLAPPVVRTVLARAFAGRGTRAFVGDSVAPWIARVAGTHPTMRAAGTGFSSSTTSLVQAVSGLGVTEHESASVSRAAARRTRGLTSLTLRAFDALPGGHRAMVVHHWEREGR